MNKTLIKNFAIDARVRLIQMAIDNAGLVGIAKDKIDSPIQKGDNFEIYKTLAGTEHTITGNEIKQRENLVNRIKKDGFEKVMEVAAYTWFNRIIAIRYMEVNDYLPARVRVLSSETSGKKEPDIITMAPDNIDLNFTEAEKQQIRELKAKQKMDEVFQLLFIKQCNELNKYLPKLFEKTSAGELDYTELLFSLSFIQTDGVVARLLEIEEEDFKDQVQIIGWMYQYYNTELKDDTFAKLKKNVKITKERIPAATQLFTPDWIVRYMVENSLGRLYAQSNTAQSEEQTAQLMGWKYYLPEAEQTEKVQKKLSEIRQAQNANFNLENIKVLDPCMGSGHILVYAFDVLIQMYKNAGYNERDATLKIMQNNIFGLDIDDRASQLTYFALMMKGRQYDRRFFEREVKPNTYAIQESNGISEKAILSVITEDDSEISIAKYILQTFKDAKEYGSIIDVEKRDFDSLKNALLAWKENHEATFENALVENDVDAILPLIEIAKVMSAKYDVVVTNPPYMGSSGMGERLSSFVKKNFPNSKSDLYAIFIEKVFDYLNNYGTVAMVTMHSWMFITSFENLRNSIVNNRTIYSINHLGMEAFDDIIGKVVATVAFVIWKNKIENFNNHSVRLVDYFDSLRNQKEKAFFEQKNNFISNQDLYKQIPGTPIAYWISNSFRNIFSNKQISEYADIKQGLTTSDNDRFVRLWFEENLLNINFNHKQTEDLNKKWYPFNKGGAYNKWYGNRDYVVNYQYDGKEIKENVLKKYSYLKTPDFVVKNSEHYFERCLSWTKVSNYFGVRYYEDGFISSDAGMSVFSQDYSLFYLLGFMNSKVALSILNVLSPTMNFEAGQISKLPIIFNSKSSICIEDKVNSAVSLSKSDWDSFETSWDFAKHPLLSSVDFKDAGANKILISDIYTKWEKECSDRFSTLKSNEEELNRIFIEIYGLQDELTPEVQDKDVTVRLADRSRDIKSFISYAVGCMFGRYSLSKEGLAYAGGDMDMSNYKYFIPDADNVIPVTDEEYFKDDIVTRFVEFVRQIYGESTLEENLRFIAESLPNKGDTPKEIIRSYFLKEL